MYHVKPRRITPPIKRPMYLYVLTVHCMGAVYQLPLVAANQAAAASRATDRYLQAERITTQRLCCIA